VLVLAVLLAVSLAALRHLDRRRAAAPSPDRRGRASRPGATRAGRHPASQAPGLPRGVTPRDPDWVQAGDGVPRVAIVIDDVGFEAGPALELSRLGLHLTFAILPHQRYTRSLAASLHAAGHEVILHLPMEPLAYPALRPGEGAVSEAMSPTDIALAVARDLDEVPEAVGVNNHMGSRATADPRVMRAVLEVVQRRGLYFLDSRTTRETVGFEMAQTMGIPALERTIFLDDRREASYIEGQVRGLLRKAREEGTAVAIGHPDPVTVEVLKRSVDLLSSDEIRVVPASELVGAPGGGSG